LENYNDYVRGPVVFITIPTLENYNDYVRGPVVFINVFTVNVGCSSGI
jgi:hypothetical protein